MSKWVNGRVEIFIVGIKFIVNFFFMLLDYIVEFRDLLRFGNNLKFSVVFVCRFLRNVFL